MLLRSTVENGESEPKTTRRHIIQEFEVLMERSLFTKLATITALASAVVSCGGSGGQKSSDKISVFDWTVQNFGADAIVTDPNNSNYIVQVGDQTASTDQGTGLIFKVDGVFPPSVADFRSSFQYQVNLSQKVEWFLVQRDSTLVAARFTYVQKMRQNMLAS